MVRVVVVGVAQRTHRPETTDGFLPPFDFMADVARQAAADAGSSAILNQVDSMHLVNMMSWVSSNPPAALAEKLSMTPKTLEYAAVGGNSPQWLVHRIADRMARGESQIALVAGCEVMHSFRLASRSGVDLGGFRESLQIPVVGTQKAGTLPIELAHDADLPVRIYPILETALRAKEGWSVGQHRHRLGRWGEDSSAVAAQNPHAWTPVARTAEEIITLTPKNRMLGYPYPRWLNSELYVDQAAVLLLATIDAARRLGIPESKWVYLHGGQDATDHWFVSHRPDLAESIAVRECVQDTLAQADRSLSDVSFFDLYSCFPVMPFLTQHMLGIGDEDPRPRTITGGLPFFGGPGNNYVTHSIAQAVERCRSRPTEFGLVTANGYYATKHSVGLYSCVEPARPWSRRDPETFQQSLSLGPAVEIDDDPTGLFRVEGYTVWHDRQGEPEYSVLVGRTESGRRTWGRTPRDPSLLQEMKNQEWVNKVGRIVGREGAVHLVDFP